MSGCGRNLKDRADKCGDTELCTLCGGVVEFVPRHITMKADGLGARPAGRPVPVFDIEPSEPV